MGTVEKCKNFFSLFKFTDFDKGAGTLRDHTCKKKSRLNNNDNSSEGKHESPVKLLVYFCEIENEPD